MQASDTTLTDVRRIIATQLAKDPADVPADSKFVDLGADSLDTVRGFSDQVFPAYKTLWLLVWVGWHRNLLLKKDWLSRDSGSNFDHITSTSWT